MIRRGAHAMYTPGEWFPGFRGSEPDEGAEVFISQNVSVDDRLRVSDEMWLPYRWDSRLTRRGTTHSRDLSLGLVPREQKMALRGTDP